MAQAPQYNPTTDFSDDERNNVGGRSTVRTANLDAELIAISASINALRSNQSLNQRDDGNIRDGRVRIFSLAAEVLALLVSYGAVPRGNWATGTLYGFKDLVNQGNNTYMAVTPHLSGVFSTDLAAGKWLLFSLGQAPSATQVVFTPGTNIVATNVQAAVEELDSDMRALISSTVTATDTAIRADYSNTASASLGDALLGVKQPYTGSVARTQHDVNADWVNVKDLGVKCDGVTDDSAALQAADNEAFLKGFHLQFPRGSVILGSVINKNPGVMWRGTGRRKAYPGVFAPGANTLSTIVPTHTGRCAIKFNSATLDAISGHCFQDLNFATLGTAGSAGPTAAFGFECGDGKFQRDFTFERCGVHGFYSAFDSYKVGTGTNIEMGVIKVFNCAISLNKWAFQTLNGTQWNSFVVMFNEMGQNGYDIGGGGINVAAYNAIIEHNILEGQRDAVYVAGSYRGISIRGNYFENNVGKACIQLKDVRGPWTVGPNNYSNINYSLLDQLVFLGTSCGQGLCLDPYWPELVHKTPIAVLGADGGTGDNVLNPLPSYQFARVDRVIGQNFTQPPMSLALVTQAVTIAQRELNPQTGMPMPVQEYTTAGVGAVPLSYTISGSSGQWVVMSWLVKQVSGAGDPYVSMNINGTSAAGSRDVPISRFSTYWLTGEWALITCATKLGAAMTSLTLNLYPHGVSPVAGQLSRFLRPVVYTTDSPTKIIPYIDTFTAQSCAPAPTAGTWVRGDQLINSAPGAGNQGSFACTASGTPGTWVFT